MELEKALDMVFDGETTAPAVVPEPAPEPQPVPAQEPAPQPAQEPEPVAEPEPKDHSVPLAKYLDTRDELKDARRRIADFEAKQQAPQTIPDPFDDPQGFAAHTTAQMTEQVTAVRFEMSEQFAKQAHGEEVVNTAIDWAGDKAKTDPIFAASYMRQPNPIDWIVRQHKRESVVSQIGDRPLDDFVKDYIARNPALIAGLASPAVAAGIPNAAITQQAPAPAAPPRSLVDAPSSGGVDHIPMGLKAGVEAVFPR